MMMTALDDDWPVMVIEVMSHFQAVSVIVAALDNHAVMVTVAIVVILDHLAMVVIIARIHAHAARAKLDCRLRVGCCWSADKNRCEESDSSSHVLSTYVVQMRKSLFEGER